MTALETLEQRDTEHARAEEDKEDRNLAFTYLILTESRPPIYMYINIVISFSIIPF